MTRDAAIVLVLILAPVPVVFLVAILRGYAITVVFRRDRRDRDR